LAAKRHLLMKTPENSRATLSPGGSGGERRKSPPSKMRTLLAGGLTALPVARQNAEATPNSTENRSKS
jgi:hypothetical protein